MTLSQELAEYLHALPAAALPAALAERVRIHLFDTIGAACAGARVPDTNALRALDRNVAVPGPALALGTGERLPLPLAVFLGVATTRCTEVDDIHAGACVTASSVIVPTAVALASCMQVDGARFLAACAGGLETIVRFGLGAGGPSILYKGIWPTYLSAGFGVAATVGILVDFTRDELASAFEVVAGLATGTTGGHAPGIPARWLVLGLAAQSALLATLAVRRGVGGDIGLLDERWSTITGIPLDRALVTGELGTRLRASEISIKPYCAAKQATAAIDAFSQLLAESPLAPESIAEVLVEVPGAYAKMIDQPAIRAGRMPTIASVHYQLALAALAPERLLDVVRTEVLSTPEITAFMAKVRVQADPSLERVYPERWPARVTVRTTGGATLVREVIAARGDPERAFDWRAAKEKFARIAFDGAREESIEESCRGLGREPGALSALLEAVS